MKSLLISSKKKVKKTNNTKRKSFWGNQETVYVEQVIFGYKINQYRRKHNLSQAEFAEICNICSEGKSGKFYPCDICLYETRKRTPNKVRFQLITSIVDAI